jgi:Ser/Thr protein kinase RdoA (MazF antagonist)
LSSCVWGNDKTQFFDSLTQDRVLDAIEALDFKTSGRVMIMASMENRVYEVEIYNDEAEHVSENFKIMKFYRPGRWSKQQIEDEHEFLFDLIKNDIQAIAPDIIKGESVFTNADGLFYSIFKKQGGRAADEWTPELLEQMGRLLARLHNTGQSKTSSHRLKLDIKTFGRDNLSLINNYEFLPMDYKSSYTNVCNEIFDIAAPLFEKIKVQRIHGDCHHGNILLKDGHPFLIDFDDMSVGPRVQDLWMIAPGRDEWDKKNFDILLDSYITMTDFDFKELKLVETLRALRIIHFSAWIGHRYKDESFKRAFPNFGTHQYWEKEVFDLNTQLQFIKDDAASLKASPY